MYRIGEFSELTGLSIKTLRYYDEIGVLQPNSVDPFTKYRLYDFTNLEDCKKIFILKRFGFSLKQIKEMKHDAVSPQVLEDRQLELQQEIQEKQEIIYEIEMMKEELTKEKEPGAKVYRINRKGIQ